jgi:hypothetical protein
MGVFDRTRLGDAPPEHTDIHYALRSFDTFDTLAGPDRRSADVPP